MPLWRRHCVLEARASREYRARFLFCSEDWVVDSNPKHLQQGWPNLLCVWAAYRKTQVPKSRNIKI